MYGWFDLKPRFLGRLKPQRFTSNQSEQALPEGTSSPSISLGPNGAVTVHTKYIFLNKNKECRKYTTVQTFSFVCILCPSISCALIT